MRNRFDNQLAELNNELISMGALCENAIASAVKSPDRRRHQARRRRDPHRPRDRPQGARDRIHVPQAAAQQQPVASDLRLISSVLKMITDIERIGDQASDIAEIVTCLSGACGHNAHIDQMAQATIKMVTDSLDAFVRRDLTLAWSVIEYDDVVDRLFDECKQDLIAEIAQSPDGRRARARCSHDRKNTSSASATTRPTSRNGWNSPSPERTRAKHTYKKARTHEIRGSQLVDKVCFHAKTAVARQRAFKKAFAAQTHKPAGLYPQEIFNESNRGGVYLGFHTLRGRKFPYGNFRTSVFAKSKHRLSEKR